MGGFSPTALMIETARNETVFERFPVQTMAIPLDSGLFFN